jgi:hypothetical protein
MRRHSGSMVRREGAGDDDSISRLTLSGSVAFSNRTLSEARLMIMALYDGVVYA